MTRTNHNTDPKMKAKRNTIIPTRGSLPVLPIPLLWESIVPAIGGNSHRYRVSPRPNGHIETGLTGDVEFADRGPVGFSKTNENQYT
ncbi:hypothetical protein [Ulvibacterium sp.]|uniref:hypothetical protein n=1 Tax=Ulvibacterium sp. TaxID=2665914 RepID=UPI003BABB3C8